MGFFTILLIGLSLSMDAFSLSLAYGTLGISKKEVIYLSSIVGIYHFFMPIIGNKIGDIVFSYIKISPNLIVFFILLFIGINLIKESFEKCEINKKNTLFSILLFGLAVSIDSFSVGIGIENITHKYLESSIIFMMCSSIFTFLGLILGKKINSILGHIATLLGGIVLIIIAVSYLI